MAWITVLSTLTSLEASRLGSRFAATRPAAARHAFVRLRVAHPRDPYATLAFGILAVLWATGVVAGLVMADVASVAILLGMPVAVVAVFLIWQTLETRPGATTVLFCITAFLVDATFRYRDYTDKSVDAQILVRASSWLLILLVALWHIGSLLPTMLTPVFLMWTVVYTWFLVTTAWAVSPVYSAIAVVSIFAFHLFSLHIAARFREQSIVETTILMVTLVSLVSILEYKLVPSLGSMTEWIGNVRVPISRMRGMTTSANAIGAQSGVGLLLIGLYWRELRRWNLLVVVAAAGICLLSVLLSQNRSTLLALAVLIFAYYLLRPRNLPWAILALGGVAIVLALVLPFVGDPLGLLSRSGKGDEITSATGRTLIWARVLLLWKDHPVFGYGYGSMLFILPNQPGLFHAASHAHNLLLESLISTGVIGFALVVSSFAVTTVTAVRWRATRPLCLMLLILIRGMTEATPFNGVASFSALSITLAAALIAVRATEGRRPRIRTAGATMPSRTAVPAAASQ